MNKLLLSSSPGAAKPNAQGCAFVHLIFKPLVNRILSSIIDCAPNLGQLPPPLNSSLALNYAQIFWDVPNIIHLKSLSRVASDSTRNLKSTVASRFLDISLELLFPWKEEKWEKTNQNPIFQRNLLWLWNVKLRAQLALCGLFSWAATGIGVVAHFGHFLQILSKK